MSLASANRRNDKLTSESLTELLAAHANAQGIPMNVLVHWLKYERVRQTCKAGMSRNQMALRLRCDPQTIDNLIKDVNGNAKHAAEHFARKPERKLAWRLAPYMSIDRPLAASEIKCAFEEGEGQMLTLPETRAGLRDAIAHGSVEEVRMNQSIKYKLTGRPYSENTPRTEKQHYVDIERMGNILLAPTAKVVFDKPIVTDAMGYATLKKLFGRQSDNDPVSESISKFTNEVIHPGPHNFGVLVVLSSLVQESSAQMHGLQVLTGFRIDDLKMYHCVTFSEAEQQQFAGTEEAILKQRIEEEVGKVIIETCEAPTCRLTVLYSGFNS